MGNRTEGLILKNSFNMFLLLAEELSFNKAAKRAFITQQCFSDHIKRLEEQYHTRFFYRKPEIALTPSGQIMKQTLLQIRMLEKNMEAVLDQIENGARGTLCFGINPNRAAVLLPKIFPAFHKMFPLVNLHITLDDTAIMAQDLLSGKIDAFLGINTLPNAMFDARHILDEGLYLIISDKTLCRYFGDNYPGCISQFKKGVSLETFREIPMIQRDAPSKLGGIIDDYCRKNHIMMNSVLLINDFDTQLRLCHNMEIVSIMPSMCISSVLEANIRDKTNSDNRMHAFPLLGLENVQRVDFIVQHGVPLPCYVQKLYELIRSEYNNGVTAEIENNGSGR
jgi:DNA-binding transcriptional LysR family regulator